MQDCMGENGLSPVTAICMLQEFVFPIMFYFLEILLSRLLSTEADIQKLQQLRQYKLGRTYNK